MQKEIKICRSLDENENPIWRMPNGMKLELYTRNSTANFRAKAVDSAGVERQVIVVDDVHDRRDVIYLEESTLDQLNDVVWLKLDPESDQYLTDHSYKAGVPDMIDMRTGLPLGIPAEGMDEAYLETLARNFVRKHYMSDAFAQPPVLSISPQFVVGLRAGLEQPTQEGQVPVTPEEMRSWYTDERWEKVRAALIYPLTVRVIEVFGPRIGNTVNAAELAEAIFDDVVLADPLSVGLCLALQKAGLNTDTAVDFTLVGEMQAVVCKILVAGAIQTPWERGEEIDWNPVS